MKKIAALAPIAILLGLPASSIAMEVELYGLIDTGFKYQNTDDFQTGKNASSFAMVSGERNGSRWGLRGNEALNDEITLGFQLESGYDSDTGAMKQNRLFGRQSVLTLNEALRHHEVWPYWIGELTQRVFSQHRSHCITLGRRYSRRRTQRVFSIPHGKITSLNTKLPRLAALL